MYKLTILKLIYLASLLFNLINLGFSQELQTYPILDKYINESKSKYEENFLDDELVKRKFYYLDVSERSKYSVTIKNGILLNNLGLPLSTINNHDYSNFVMDSKGNLYIGPQEMHHSYFLAGEHVAAAGEIQVELGRIKFLSNKSGHYEPPSQSLLQFVNILENQHVELSETKFEIRKKAYDFTSTKGVQNLKTEVLKILNTNSKKCQQLFINIK